MKLDDIKNFVKSEPIISIWIVISILIAIAIPFSNTPMGYLMLLPFIITLIFYIAHILLGYLDLLVYGKPLVNNQPISSDQIYCPFCGNVYEDKLDVVQNNAVYIHPIDTNDKFKSPDNFFKDICKVDFKESTFECKNTDCKKKFHVQLISLQTIANQKSSVSKYYLNLLVGRCEKIVKKPLIEFILDLFFNKIFEKLFYFIFRLKKESHERDSRFYNFVGCLVLTILIYLFVSLPEIINGHNL